MARQIRVGEKAPDFVLPDTDFKHRSLQDFKEMKVVLAFYPGAFTSVCSKEMCTFRDSLAKLNALKAQVVGISVNDPFSNKGFSDANGLNFPLLSDYKREVVKSYGVTLENFAGLEGYAAAKRSIFILDREGIVRYAWVSETPGIEPDYQAIEQILEGME